MLDCATVLLEVSREMSSERAGFKTGNHKLLLILGKFRHLFCQEFTWGLLTAVRKSPAFRMVGQRYTQEI